MSIIEKQINNCSFKIVQGDVTDLSTDAIVNAANSQLQLGAGVAGAIRKKGGSSIQKECNEIGKCKLGEAVITSGGNLKAKYVIHAVGPRYGIDFEPEMNLYSAIYSSLEVARDNKLTSIGIPAVSTGIYGFPVEDAAICIINAIDDFLTEEEDNSLNEIVLCLFSDKDYEIFANIFSK